MKKTVAMLLCLALLGGVCAFAEGTVALGTIGNSKFAYSVTCETPSKYTVFHKQPDNQSVEGMLANDSTKGMSYLFVIAVDEDSADIESLASLDGETLNQRIAAYEEEGLKITVKDQGGMKFLWLADKGAKKNAFLSIETVLHGCLIQISASPVEQVVSTMSDKQAQTAMDFLATLAFSPADPFPAEETDEAEEPEAEEETIEEIIDEKPEEEEALPETAPVLLGGWNVSEEPIQASLSEPERQVFDQAAALTGMDYEPAAVLATQVVAGTNSAYLCQERDGDREWIVVTIYSGLNGEVQILNAHVLSLYNLLTTEKDLPAKLAGGWSLRAVDNSAPLPEEAHAAFGQAVKAANENLSPVALLATQVVAGINYKVLAQGENALYVVDVYAPLTGDASITDMEMLDLLAYVSAN